jgi:hypothetical protein
MEERYKACRGCGEWRWRCNCATDATTARSRAFIEVAAEIERRIASVSDFDPSSAKDEMRGLVEWCEQQATAKPAK